MPFASIFDALGTPYYSLIINSVIKKSNYTRRSRVEFILLIHGEWNYFPNCMRIHVITY